MQKLDDETINTVMGLINTSVANGIMNECEAREGTLTVAIVNDRRRRLDQRISKKLGIGYEEWLDSQSRHE